MPRIPRPWMFGLLILVALLLVSCAPGSLGITSSSGSGVTSPVEIVGADSAPEDFVGYSWGGILWTVIKFLFFIATYIACTKLKSYERVIWLLVCGQIFSVFAAIWQLLNVISVSLVAYWAYEELNLLNFWSLQMITRTVMFFSVWLVTFLIYTWWIQPDHSLRKDLKKVPAPGPEPEKPAFSDRWNSPKSQAYSQWQEKQSAYETAQSDLSELNKQNRWWILGRLFVSFLFGWLFQFDWMTVLKYLLQVSWDEQVAVLGQPVGFYVYDLPMISLIMTYLLWLIIIGMLARGIAAWAEDEDFESGVISITPLVIPLGILLGLSSLLSIFDLVFTEGAKYSGITTADYHVGIVCRYVFALILVISSGWITVKLRKLQNNKGSLYDWWEDTNNDWIKVLKVFQFATPLWLLPIIMLVLFTLVPGLYYGVALSGRPDESQKEQIIWNIAATRKAYGIDQAMEQDFTLKPTADPALFDYNQEPWKDVRLWDWRVVERYLDLRQIGQPAYGFIDVDPNRVWVTEKDGTKHEMAVMTSIREPETEKLPSDQQSFATRRVRIISAKGWVIADPSEITTEKYPQLLASNLPIQSDYKEFNPKQFHLYYSEAATNWAVGRANVAEYDLPQTDGSSTDYLYTGTGGVKRTLLTQLAFGWYWKNWSVLIGSYLSDDSVFLINKNIARRAMALPLDYSYDPYSLGYNDQIDFLWDAYLWTDKYPNATAYTVSLPNAPWQTDKKLTVRYMRPSIKVLIDGYNGAMTFYAMDQSPLTQTYNRIFGEILVPASEMPAQVREQSRYPEEMFDLQRTVIERYHETDPIKFFNPGVSRWITAEEMINENTPGQIESRYLITKLPGEETQEFVMANYYSPQKSRNLSAYLSVRNDGQNYGQLVLVKFKVGTQLTGPADAEHRAHTEGPVATALSNWRGAGVLPGNLTIVPVGDSYVYLEPIHLVPNDSKGPATTNLVVIIPPTGEPAYHLDLPRALKALKGEIPSYAPLFNSSESQGQQPAVLPSPTTALPSLTPTTSGGVVVPVKTASPDCALLWQQLSAQSQQGQDPKKALDLVNQLIQKCQ